MCDLLFDDGLLPLLVSVTWVSQHGVTSCKAHKLDGRLMSARLFNCSATKRLPPSAGGPVVRSPAGSDSHVRRAPRRFGAALTNSRRRSPSLTFRVRLPRRTEHTAAERLSEGGRRKLRQSLAQNSAQRPTPAPLDPHRCPNTVSQSHWSFSSWFFARGVYRKCVCTVCQSCVLRWTGSESVITSACVSSTVGLFHSVGRICFLTTGIH